MNWLLNFAISTVTLLLLFNALILLAAYIGVYVIQPLYPAWWERNIVSPDPEYFKPISSSAQLIRSR